MKIAMIGQKGIPAVYGGIEKHVQDLSLHLSDMGDSIYVYTRPYYTDKTKKNFNKIKLISLPCIHTKNLDAISHTLFSTIHALFQDYDIIHYHAVGPALLSFIPRILKPKARIVVTFHCLDRQHQKWSRFAKLMLWLGERAACKFAHEVITVSKTLTDYCYEVYNRETKYLPNGINAPKKSQPSIILKKFNLSTDDYILSVARLIPHKGLHHLIKVYQQIKTNKKLVIVGDGYFTDKYVKLLKKLANNNPNIIFTGWQSGKALDELYTNAYAYIHPSESEGLPIAVLEAASYGKCVLASDIPANNEIVRECGLSFKNKNLVDLKEKFEYLLKNEDVVQATGKYARQHVLKHYNWDEIAKETRELYLNTLFHKAIKEKSEVVI